MFESRWGGNNNPFLGGNPFSGGNPFGVRNAGVKYKRNPIYELNDIKLVKIEDIPDKVITQGKFLEVVDPDFVGKLVVICEKDNIGKSGGHPQWCKIYDCNDGRVTYKGTAIHKCVDLDCTEQNYNEKLFSIYGKLVFDQSRVGIPDVDLVKNIGYEENKPAVLSYNVTKRESHMTRDVEEMILMKTIVFNKLERREIKDNRTCLDVILDTVKMQVMKRVGYKKNDVKDEIDDKIISLKVSIASGEPETELYQKQIDLLSAIKNKIDIVDANTDFDEFLKSVEKDLGRKIDSDELAKIDIHGEHIVDFVNSIRYVAAEKEADYKKLEKDIIQITVFDLMTNNIDRHLTNWALLRNKKTDKYRIGLFDHAAAFFNIGLKNGNIAITDEYLNANWAPSSVILDSPMDKQIVSSKGIEVFKHLMEHYREYTVEMLQKMYDALPEFKRQIGFVSIPNAEYEKLSEEEKKNYYNGDMEIAVSPQKVEKGLKSKFSRITREYGISFKTEKEKTREE